MKVSQLDKRDYIKLDDNIYQVIDVVHTHLGRGGANVSLILKDIGSGKRLEKNFKSDYDVELIDIEEKEIKFSHRKGNNLIFRDKDKEYILSTKDKENILPYLVNGRNYIGLFFEEKLINIILPKIIHFKVIASPPGIKGDSVQTSTKYVEVENGYQFKVPLFIKTGDIIAINSETGEYIERVNS